MKRRYVLFSLIFLKSFNLFSQDSCIKQDSIPWSKKARLQWSDFSGRPDTLSQGTAGCAASIYVKGISDNGLPNFLVSNFFVKNRAWTKDSTSSILLQHEQLHFDIAEIYARKIRKAIDSLRKRKVRTVNNYSLEIMKLLKMRDETDSLYDEQTSHGVNGKAQFDWTQKILKELEALNDYAVKPQLKKEPPP